ncbi:protein ALTERED PHOSPHATE STARVATION RESPONSE 1 [Andrographis paniculata]|uniref:protein ALTERED PHOSPHATE STARVATION RESPONSE 1 n=1 Tax=Andrographis paniculata TaxID=175694 RepID=UPI0021E80CBA|nr:protein ALTERED PHOSPHATE STARVATION RESPONSE 1 [Andrographis paniculata]XP_051125951.1 protein ALTERED PHOSPHATE STARVATION RESPONSE 1 [Andrographis paniculata]
MGCVASRIDKEERVRICKDRKRLAKQLLGYRKEFADAQLAYLRSLRNTGVTLRQFTESESLELEDNTTSRVAGFPPSPSLPLPPSPPPPPNFSPDLRRKFEDDKRPSTAPEVEEEEEIIELNEEGGHTPPPPVPTSSWEYWDPFGSASLQCGRNSETVDQDEDDEENWIDTNSEFVDENDDSIPAADDIDRQHQSVELVDDSASMMSSHTKDSSSDMAMVVWSKKTLASVIKDVDEYFLKASGVVKDIAVFIDMDATGGTFLYQSIKESKRKRSNSAKVFSALTWSWSSKSLHFARETGSPSVSSDPCKPGAHCITLQKLYSEEQKLYKDVKEEETSKVEFARKTLLLQRQEEEHDWGKVEKTRSALDSLQSYILSLQESIGRSCSTILMVMNQELHPQLIALASGLMHTWQTMNRCHQVQNHISQQLSCLTDQQNAEPTTEYHQQAAAQLQREVASWYDSFCRLVKFQREYVRTLRQWTKLTDCLEVNGNSETGQSSKLRIAVEKWLQELDKAPDKMVSDAIKSLLSGVHMIVTQQQEEVNARKRSEKVARKLEREADLLSEMEMKFAGSSFLEDATSKHPLVMKRAKVESMRRLVNDEKAKFESCVKLTRGMIHSNLQTGLPKVFQALMAYSSASARSFEEVLNNACEEDTQTAAEYGI